MKFTGLHCKCRHIKLTDRGFTLLEIMVSIAIIAIAFISILKLHTETVAMDIASNFYLQAPLLTQKIMSEYEAGIKITGSAPDLNSALKEFPGFTFEISQKTFSSDILCYKTSPLLKNMDDNRSELVKIICTVSYNHGEYHYTNSSLRVLPK